jgi:hypothetical protein
MENTFTHAPQLRPKTMKRHVLFGLAATMLWATPCGVFGDANEALTSTSNLTGVLEADDSDPAYVSSGKATATITFASDFTSAQVGVRFSNLEGDLTRFQLSCLAMGVEVAAVELVDRSEPLLDVHPNVRAAGAFIVGTLTNANFLKRSRAQAIGCVDEQTKPIDSLVLLAAAIQRRQIYWSLHTDAFPKTTELRGLVQRVVR